MNTIIAFTLFIALVSAQDSIRFVNNVENTTIRIYSNKLDTITLPFMGVSQFFNVSDGVLSITNVLDQNSSSLTGGTPLLTEFGAHYTLVATINKAETDPTKRFVLALFNESAPAGFDQSTDSTKAWIRFLVLTQDIQYLTLASPAGAIVSYAGFLTYTPYTSIAASTTNMRVYKSDTQTYNTPLIVFNTTFVGLEAYTIMFFTENNGTLSFVSVIDDRHVGAESSTTTAAGTTTGAQGTSTGAQGTTTAQGTGAQGTSTGSQATGAMTSGVVSPVTTKAPVEVTTQGVINNNENSASKLAFGVASLIALIALF